MFVSKSEFDELRQDIEDLKNSDKNNRIMIKNLLYMLQKLKDFSLHNNKEISGVLNDVCRYIPLSTGAISDLNDRLKNTEKAIALMSEYINMKLDGDIKNKEEGNEKDFFDSLDKLSKQDYSVFNIDNILDKMNESGGIDGLSDEEKNFLAGLK